MWKQMSPLAHPKGKTPSRSCNLRKGVLFSAYGRALLRTTSQSRRKLLDSSPSRGASGEEEKFSAMPKPPLGRGGGTASAVTERLSPAAAHGQGSPSYNLSVSLRSTAPLVGEPLAKPFTLRGLPKPPLGRGGGTASAVTERLSPAAAHGQALLRTTSQSRFARQLP